MLDVICADQLSTCYWISNLFPCSNRTAVAWQISAASRSCHRISLTSPWLKVSPRCGDVARRAVTNPSKQDRKVSKMTRRHNDHIPTSLVSTGLRTMCTLPSDHEVRHQTSTVVVLILNGAVWAKLVQVFATIQIPFSESCSPVVILQFYTGKRLCGLDTNSSCHPHVKAGGRGVGRTTK